MPVRTHPYLFIFNFIFPFSVIAKKNMSPPVKVISYNKDKVIKRKHKPSMSLINIKSNLRVNRNFKFQP